MAQLFLVPTPIGNLKDMTFRAVEVLNEVELILAEDTRTSAKLMQHFDISTPLHSHHMHNEHASLPKICLLYTSPSPRNRQKSRMPSSA